LPPGSRWFDRLTTLSKAEGMRFDLTSKKNPLTAPQNLIAKLLGQRPVNPSILPKPREITLMT
jgi:hypothetical protein